MAWLKDSSLKPLPLAFPSLGEGSVGKIKRGGQNGREEKNQGKNLYQRIEAFPSDDTAGGLG
jgi:hypothetical protein